jgi:hypothetical protein
MRYLIAASVLGLAGSAMAETWTVDDDGPADFDNIQAAVDAASDGDEIIVSPGTYTGSGEDVVFIEWSNLWIHSADGASVTIIDGQGKQRGVHYRRAAGTLDGFTIQNCFASTAGAGVYCQGSNPTIVNCVVSDNVTTGNGAGIHCEYYSTNSSPLIQGCIIQGNSAIASGGGVYLYGDGAVTRVVDTTIADNTAGANGGGVFNNQPGTILTNSILQDNTSALSGGGLYNTVSSAYVGQCQFSGNSATSGGAAFCLSTTYFSDNSACENSEPQLIGEWVDNGGNQITTVCGNGACCTGNTTGCVMATELDCTYFGGTFLGWSVDCAEAACPTTCLGDVNGDGEVSVNDILTVVANWGPCP